MTTELATSKQDFIGATILRNKLEAVVAEMEATLINTAYSATIGTARHCATGLVTEQGQLIAISNPLYLYVIPCSARAVIDRFQYDLSSEDVLLTNDPYGGGTQIQTFTLVAPFSLGDSISLYLVVSGRTEDFGGNLRGGLNPSATEIWAEGARCPPVRLVKEGKVRKDLLKTLSLNTRNPIAFGLDVDAMLAAAQIGTRRLEDVFTSYGAGAVFTSIDWMLDYSERRMRALLERIPAGRYEGSSCLGQDGHGRSNLTVRVTVVVERGEVTFDFTGTDPQSAGFMNMSQSAAATFAVLPLMTILSGEIPCNSGALRCVKIIASQGSLVNPTFPAPTGWCLQHLGHEVSEAVCAALSEPLAGQIGHVIANSMLLFSTLRIERHGKTSEQAEVFDFSNFVQGQTDATPEHDGWGSPGVSSRIPLPSVELYESERGGRIEQLEYATDSAGAGRNRGAPGTVAKIAVLHSEIGELHLTAALVASTASPCPATGTAAQNGIEISCEGKVTTITEFLTDWKLTGGVELTLRMAGGRGWGAPTDRPAEQVRDDVANGLISAEAARYVYRVAINPETLVINGTLTARLRSGSAERSEVHANG